MRHHAGFIASLIIFGSPWFGVDAQSQDPATAAPKIAVKAARVLDVKKGEYLADGVVLIEGDVIKEVGTKLPIPAGFEVIDLGDASLLPGLIDAHSHLMADTSIEGYADMLLTKSQAYRALEGAAHAKKTLRAGFTTVRDVENEGSEYADVALRDAIQRGLVEGPRMRVATRGIAAVGQYHPFGISPDLPDFPHGAQMVSGVEEARRAVREQIGYGANLIKVYADWRYPTLTVDELRVVVEEAHKANRRVAAHAATDQGILNALEAGADSIEHGFGAKRATLEKMKEKGIWLVPTVAGLAKELEAAGDPKALEFLQQVREMVRIANEVGVKIACGYDSTEIAQQGTNARELLALHNAGLTNLEAIRAATLSAADLLGWADKVGALEAGKYADLIAVTGDPLSDLKTLEHVFFVMKGGVVVKREEGVKAGR
jgi:imidazolonepropionase-like amidohydrolase